jgi:aminoglycoside 3-N-acetyltransferase
MDSTSCVRALADDLERLGVREGEAMLVHSSLRSLGPLPGGAETVVTALQQALGEEGLLLMPAHSYATVTASSPRFDIRSTPSCVGALTEYFRRRAETIRSLHPTHSVCGSGVRAREILSAHEKDNTPCGPNSAYHRVRDLDGQILFLGCGLDSNTSMHAVEELVQPPYLFAHSPVTFSLVNEHGFETSRSHRVHSFAGMRQRYDRLAAELGDQELKTGSVGKAACFLLEASGVWRAGLGALSRDPLAFVDAIG